VLSVTVRVQNIIIEVTRLYRQGSMMSSEAEKLIDEAKKKSGVAEAMEVYARAAIVRDKAAPSLSTRRTKIVFRTSDRTG
jgi:hypothetical protein